MNNHMKIQMKSKVKKLNRLFVFYKNKEVGLIIQHEDETISFEYSEFWRNDRESFELAPSLALTHSGPFNNKLTRAYFENLLPEGKAREKINYANRGVADNFKFLKQFGEDNAGAFVITPSYDFLNFKPTENMGDMLEVPIKELDKALDAKQNLTAFIHKKFKGRFSLAGTQDKMAFVHRDEKIFIPHPHHTHGNHYFS